MLKILKARWEQGRRTMPFPGGATQLPARFRGRPIAATGECASSCPTQAVQTDADGQARVDLGRCLFCQDCGMRYSADHRMAATDRQGLMIQGEEIPRVRKLDEKMRRLFGRSLKLREVCAGSCNGCEMELQALGNVVFDLGRFGIQFVAAPRHADGLVVTGPVTQNMRLALLKTYEAVPSPKIVIAAGACAISGGPFRDAPQVHNGVDMLLPVDLYIPGCPPHPLTILDGLLRLLDRIEDGTHAVEASP